ncbi:NAD(P)H-dependent oxidoreductase [Ktedonosporobacter rubrisoli]|uniref:NAD(P)H-dependent oxidoreductase n=1 Tax=Ktedonosporobacter rubrisoli TaxID=2509675 RepID=A0A4P6K1W3_KTERU|nr:NADPH-dependent FMN reductase [Ktedonosporobacter rubrisoli]QBD81975.1 NAD(P)H-dependent oxidoreductase [Ktedonosporobacter rubrisoli]
MKTIHIAGIVGSLRQKSYNKWALQAAAHELPAGAELEIISIADLPMYNQDLEEAGDPAVVQAFKEKLREADAVLIATPEYNYSVPGVLKNALDWASRPTGKSVLTGKPVAIMGASYGPYGTVRAQMSLRQSLGYINAFSLNKPDVFITYADQKFAADGDLRDVKTREQIRALLEALVEWTRLLAR